MSKELVCSTCRGRMIRGFTFDRGDYHQYILQQIWVEGEPESSFWSGLKTSGRDSRVVDAYRCSECDRLEFFAVAKANI